MISELLRKDGYAHFKYKSMYSGGTNVVLQIILYKPITKSHDLLHQLNGINCIDALQKMYDFIK